jgi:glycosyltransferase involved in cell wall biosynthesis
MSNLVSTIMPAYNVELWIAVTIQSALEANLVEQYSNCC